ncbi:MAG TPA: DDE-type integrase/transposase/recombinase [Victivallales bacterium]|nr:DDE-type integrase/transposase/recombinase [Victivallales bacterium]
MLLLNSVYKYYEFERKERVLWFNIELNLISVIDINNNTAWPEILKFSDYYDRLISDEIIQVDDPFTLLPDNLSAKDIHIRDRAWDIISKIVSSEPEVYYKKNRIIIVNETLESKTTNLPTLYKYLRKYWQRGKGKNSLLPDYKNCGSVKDRKIEKKRGRPRKDNIFKDEGINITDELKNVIIKSSKKYYEKRNRISFITSYEFMIKHYFSDKNSNTGKWIVRKERPTFSQYKYWYNKLFKPDQKIIKRDGIIKYNKKHRPIKHTTNSEVKAPGEYYQIDATIADFSLVSSKDRTKIIGKPTLYFAIDVFSRMIVGFYVGLEPASWLCALLTIENCTKNKDELLIEYGLKNNYDDNIWPCKYLPDAFLADRGELEGYNIENLINDFGVRIENTPPYRADLKGIVERLFKTIQEKLKAHIPGYMHKDHKTRGSKDYRLDAIICIDAFIKILIIEIIDYNTNHYITGYDMDSDMIRDTVQPIPIKLWRWGIKNRSGKLKEFPRDKITFSLLPKDKAQVTSKGVLFKNCYYLSEDTNYDIWLMQARSKTWKIDISYDPRTVNFIYYKNSNNKIVKFYISEISRGYKNISFYELKMHIDKKNKKRSEFENGSISNTINKHQYIENILKKETQLTESHTIPFKTSKAQKVKSINKNRSDERFYNYDNLSIIDNSRKRPNQKKEEELTAHNKDNTINDEPDIVSKYRKNKKR